MSLQMGHEPLWAHSLPHEELVMLLAFRQWEEDDKVRQRQDAGLRKLGLL